jgi:heat-inducible transcriptional repressor
MIDLTDRQIQILKAVIEEYLETADPVGSEVLDKKYHLGVSPATIRNEMMVLTNQGFLKQPHISAGRVPTPMALRFYVNRLMEEKDLSVAEEVAVKSKIWDYRTEIDKLLQETVRVLADKTRSLAIATTDRGDFYHSGYANILNDPEFYDIDVARTVLGLLDNIEAIKKILNKAMGEEEIHLLLGDDFEVQLLQSCGFVFSDFKTKKLSGNLGIVGSCRLDYSEVFPNLRYITQLIEEIGRAW